MRRWLQSVGLGPRALGTTVGPIGLDLGWEELRAVQLERRGGRIGLRAALRAPYPGDREALLGDAGRLREFVRAALRGSEVGGPRVVSIMPPGTARLMVLGYQHGADDDDAGRILSLVAERIREPLEELVVDYLPVRTSGDKHGERSALVAVARREEVVAYLERLRSCGLQVDCLEIPPVAVRRLVDHASAGDEETVLVIHADGPTSSLFVLWGRRLILYRELEFSEEDAVEHVAKGLDLPPDAARSLLEEHGIEASSDPAVASVLREILKPALYALAEDARKAAVYTASKTHGAVIERLRVLGGFGTWPGVAGFLGEVLALPVDPLDPLAGFERDRPGSAGGFAFATATGLALRGLTE